MTGSFVCRRCAKPCFQTNKARFKLYCDECAPIVQKEQIRAYHYRQRGGPPREKLSSDELLRRDLARRDAEKAKRLAARIAKYGTACQRCGTEHSRASYFCSGKCERSHSRGSRIPGPRTCPNCKTQFQQQFPYEVFCSRPCARRTHLRIKSAKRRSVYYAVEVIEQVDPVAVFVRDGWTCQACGGPTPVFLRGLHVDASPELDHRIPITRGGSHTYDNTQCLCRSCNGAKGDMTMDEFMQFLNSYA